MLFIGRTREKQQLEAIGRSNRASLVVVYGRRRTGKTTLIEHVYSKRHLLKFEGIEDLGKQGQIANFMRSLRAYFPTPILNHVNPSTWKECFEILADLVRAGEWTVYLEELQWMAEYKTELIAELKPVWDNMFQKNPQLVMVLCGSAPSFFIKNVIRSRALYNRASDEILLSEFSLDESKSFLSKSAQKDVREVFNSYLAVGGIPIYLNKVSDSSSSYLSLCQHSSAQGAFFVEEFEKIFVSSFGRNETYRKIIEFIAKKNSVTRGEILAYVKASSGGTISKLLIDLELCGFIQKITPLNKNKQSLVMQYRISDSYLHFYFTFIRPNLQKILAGEFREMPTKLIELNKYWQWLGLAFERYCLKNTYKIAKILDFAAVSYDAGSYFKRGTSASAGVQIDLMYVRADRVTTVCEIKYGISPVDRDVIASVETKIKKLAIDKKTRVQRVLIAAAGASESLINANYFDRIISLEDLL